MKRYVLGETADGDREIVDRELGAVDEAIAALVTAGVPLGKVEIHIYPCAGQPVTVVKSKGSGP